MGGYKNEEKDEKVHGGCSASFSDEYGVDSLFWIWWEKKSTTTSSGGGEEKKSEIKYAAKQVLNRTENQEIPTMDVSKSTDTLGSQILGNTMEGLYRLDKDNKPIPAAAESSTKSEDGKNIHLNYVKMQNGQTVIL